MSAAYKGAVNGSRDREWVVSSGYSSDTMGEVVCQRSHQWSPNHTTRQSRAMKKLSGKADQLAICSYSVVVRMSVAS